jgi:hypothetical protein
MSAHGIRLTPGKEPTHEAFSDRIEARGTPGFRVDLRFHFVDAAGEARDAAWKIISARIRDCH